MSPAPRSRRRPAIPHAHCPATPDELAGEQDALAMFRANVVHPRARCLPARSCRPVPAGTAFRRPPASPGAGSRRSAARVRPPLRWGIRLAAAGTLALGGTAAAAYATALPAPVQHIAHAVLGFAGVPDDSRGSAPSPHRHHHHTGRPPAGRRRVRPGAAGSDGTDFTQRVAVGDGLGNSDSLGRRWPALLSAAAASTEITAGWTRSSTAG